MQHRKIEPADVAQLAERYRSGERIGRLAAEVGISRAWARVLLDRAGVPLRSGRVVCLCAHCGAELIAWRARAERTRRCFCGPACHAAGIANPSFKESTHQRRKAREVVWKFFALAPGNVVHHVDGDETHNDPGNLWVFASQSDHMRWHRGGGEASRAVPLWRGDRPS